MSARQPIFHHRRHDWLFDLDNTLYPAECALFPQVEARIGRYVQDLLKLPAEAARARQKELFMTHGTTLRGLMAEYGVDPHAYLDFVGDIDFSPIRPDPALRDALAALDGRRLVFTNADRPYAEKVLDRLGIADLFEGLFDIFDAGFVPKPVDAPYDALIAQHDIDPERAVFFEDMARNLTPAHARGIATVWIDTGSPWGAADYARESIHSTTPSLKAWLEEYHAHRGRSADEAVGVTVVD